MFDVSEANGGEPFDTLSDALDYADSVLLESQKKGGMTIKYIQSSDNKYVQYRLMSDIFNTTHTNWQGVDDEPVAGSHNLVESGGVKAAISTLDNLKNIKEDKFAITDDNGNIGLQYDANGLDATNVSTHFKGLVVNDERDRALAAEAALSSSISDIEENIEEFPDNIITTKEEVFSIADENGNVALTVNKAGATDVYQIGSNLASIIENLINNNSTLQYNDGEYASVLKRVNDTVREVRTLNNKIDDSIPSLLAIEKSSNHTTKQITVPSIGAVEKRLVRVGLHYGAEAGTPQSDDIFFNGACEKDFSDVRFFDSNGNILKAQFGECVNMEPIFDSNLNNAKYLLSDGTIVGQDNGIVLSQDGGATWNAIAGTTTQDSHPSSAYGRDYMWPVFVDSSDNIFAYRGGKLYKLSSSDSYATITEVLDYTWNNNGTTVYPDIQPTAMAEDINGNLFVGACYQNEYHTSVFVSTDGGNTFSLAWASWDAEHIDEYGSHAQHVHHIHASPYNSDVYVGIDDGATFWNGSIILKTSDGGSTWTDITKTNHAQRGRDYYPTYFGDGTYRLGGGEVYVTGGNAIIRSEDDEVYDSVMLGTGGVRTFSDFGNDSLIVAGVQSNDNNSTRQIVYSNDKGKTWHTILSKDIKPFTHSGSGFRVALPSKTIRGENESSILFVKDINDIPAMKLYKGGNHYYREVYVLLENLPDAPVTITAKTGYMMPYPFKQLNRTSSIKPVYSVALNEGFGRYIYDSDGNCAVIRGDYSWDKQETVRWGDYRGIDNKRGDFSSALKVTNILNFGKIKSLNFNDNYSITFWINEKERELKDVPDDRFSSINNFTFYHIFGFGDIVLYRFNQTLGLFRKSNNTRNGIAIPQSIKFSDNYFFIALVVKNGAIEVSLNGNVLNTTMAINTITDLNKDNLSDGDFYIGSDSVEMPGWISNINIYNAALTEKQINALYKGYYNY